LDKLPSMKEMVNILAFVNQPPWHIKAVIIAVFSHGANEIAPRRPVIGPFVQSLEKSSGPSLDSTLEANQRTTHRRCR
jgi:hypothetical protein